MTIEELYKQSVRNGTEQNLLAETNEISFGYNDGVFKIIYNTAVQWHRFKEEIPDDMERVIVYEPNSGEKYQAFVIGVDELVYIFEDDVEKLGIEIKGLF